MLEYFGFYDTPESRPPQAEPPVRDTERSPDAPCSRTAARLRHTEPVEPPRRMWDLSG